MVGVIVVGQIKIYTTVSFYESTTARMSDNVSSDLIAHYMLYLLVGEHELPFISIQA